MRTLGLDPGANGAAVLLDDLSVLSWWAWTESRGGWRVRSSQGEFRSGTIHDLAMHLCRCGPLRVAVEGLYLPRGPKAQSVLPLAESAGELIGPLRVFGTVHRPTWQTWAAQLGLSSMAGKRSEGVVVQEARRRFEWSPYPGGELTLGEELAVCEAAWIARWVASC